MKKKKKSSLGLARFMLTTLLLVALVFAALMYGPVISDYFYFRTPNYRAFGVSVPSGYPITGIDVSRYQGKIDWKKVKEMRSGKYQICFVFAKATEGLSYEDPQYKRNKKQCEEYDIPFGAYHYFIPSLNVTKQADFFAKNFKPQKGNLPPVVDIETTSNLNREQVRDSLKKFIKRIETKTGVRPIIYSYHKFYKEYLLDGYENYTIWLAHYGPGKPHDQPWTFWQFSEKSTISGIKHRVDLNVFKGDSAAFEKIKVR